MLLRQPTRTERLVFLSKTGRRLSQPTLAGYWAQVKAAAGLDLDFYLATKHYGVHLLYKLGLSRPGIAAQMGWSERAVEKLLKVYRHIAAAGHIRRTLRRRGGEKWLAEPVLSSRPDQAKARSGSGLFANDQCPRPTKCLSQWAVSVCAASGEPIGFDLELCVMAAGGP